MSLFSLRPTHKMRLYHRGAAFFKKMRGKVSKMSEKQNIRDHKRRLLAAKYELIEKAFSICKDTDRSSDMRDKHRKSQVTEELSDELTKEALKMDMNEVLMGIKKSSW
ncbi:hypothetical protein R6Q59_015660 [Mikania micrantha]